MIRNIVVALLLLPLLFLAYSIGHLHTKADFARTLNQTIAAEQDAKAAFYLLVVFAVIWLLVNFGVGP